MARPAKKRGQRARTTVLGPARAKNNRPQSKTRALAGARVAA